MKIKINNTRNLTEKYWKFRLPNDIHKAIKEEDPHNVLNALKDAIDILKDKGIMDEYDYYEFSDDIENQLDNADYYEDYDMTYEDVLDEIDYILSEFYDWCDANSVWIEL